MSNSVVKPPVVGDVFRVFEIVRDVYDYDLRSRQFAELKNRHFGEEFGVDIPVKLLNTGTYIHIGIDERKHGKLIGKLVVTGLKGGPNA